MGSIFQLSPVMSLQTEIQELFSYLAQYRTANEMTLSAIVFLVYDAVTSAGLEVDLIWKARWSFVTGLYFCARYYGMGHLIYVFFVNTTIQPSAQMCRTSIWVASLGGPVLFSTTVNAIFILRIYALYDNSRIVLITLILFVTAEFGMECYESIARTFVEKVIELPISLPISGCLLDQSGYKSKTGLIAWLPCLIVSFLFFVMTLAKFITMARAQGGSFTTAKTAFSPLHWRLLQDGTLYFFILFSVVLVAAVLDVRTATIFEESALNWLMALYSFSGSKLILNLRESANRTNLSMISNTNPNTAFSDVRFNNAHSHVTSNQSEDTDLALTINEEHSPALDNDDLATEARSQGGVYAV